MLYWPRFEVPHCFDNECWCILQSSTVTTDMWLPMFRRSIMSSSGSEVQEQGVFLNVCYWTQLKIPHTWIFVFYCYHNVRLSHLKRKRSKINFRNKNLGRTRKAKGLLTQPVTAIVMFSFTDCIEYGAGCTVRKGKNKITFFIKTNYKLKGDRWWWHSG
jgi:hypothetical protein